MNTRLTTPVISRWLLYAVIATCVIVAGVIIILYAQNRLYDCNLPVDAALFGNYGDFIGGVIGTFIALYSAYLLVRTLENQAVTNESVIATNDSVITANNASIAASQMEGYLTQLQTFDSKFSNG